MIHLRHDRNNCPRGSGLRSDTARPHADVVGQGSQEEHSGLNCPCNLRYCLAGCVWRGCLDKKQIYMRIVPKSERLPFFSRKKSEEGGGKTFLFPFLFTYLLTSFISARIHILFHLFFTRCSQFCLFAEIAFLAGDAKLRTYGSTKFRF